MLHSIAWESRYLYRLFVRNSQSQYGVESSERFATLKSCPPILLLPLVVSFLLLNTFCVATSAPSVVHLLFVTMYNIHDVKLSRPPPTRPPLTLHQFSARSTLSLHPYTSSLPSIICNLEAIQSRFSFDKIRYILFYDTHLKLCLFLFVYLQSLHEVYAIWLR